MSLNNLSTKDLQQLVAKYQAQADKYYDEAFKAKAQVYDLLHLGEKPTTNEHLKCRIYDMENEILELKKSHAKELATLLKHSKESA